MKKQIALVVIILALAVSPACSGTDEDTAKALVDKGIAHVLAVGAEKGAADFMTPDGGYIDRNFYLLFYAYDGMCLALGATPEVAGKNRWNVRDPRGIYQVREMIKTAKAGGGWVKYLFADPISGELGEKKTWVRPVPGMEAFMGCGVYK